MASQQMTPDLSYPGGVTGTQKPLEQPFEDWFRKRFENRGRLVAVSAVRLGARHYSLNPTMQATGVAYAAWGVNGRIVAEIYPFHEAAKSNDDTHNFFWQALSEEDNPTFFDASRSRQRMERSPLSQSVSRRF
jgi:hypothetical protein